MRIPWAWQVLRLVPGALVAALLLAGCVAPTQQEVDAASAESVEPGREFVVPAGGAILLSVNQTGTNATFEAVFPLSAREDGAVFYMFAANGSDDGAFAFMAATLSPKGVVIRKDGDQTTLPEDRTDLRRGGGTHLGLDYRTYEGNFSAAWSIIVATSSAMPGIFWVNGSDVRVDSSIDAPGSAWSPREADWRGLNVGASRLVPEAPPHGVEVAQDYATSWTTKEGTYAFILSNAYTLADTRWERRVLQDTDERYVLERYQATALMEIGAYNENRSLRLDGYLVESQDRAWSYVIEDRVAANPVEDAVLIVDLPVPRQKTRVW